MESDLRAILKEFLHTQDKAALTKTVPVMPGNADDYDAILNEAYDRNMKPFWVEQERGAYTNRVVDSKTRYTVQEGDTWAKIGAKFEVPPEDIVVANPHVSPMTMSPGDVLFIPDKLDYRDFVNAIISPLNMEGSGPPKPEKAWRPEPPVTSGKQKWNERIAGVFNPVYDRVAKTSPRLANYLSLGAAAIPAVAGIPGDVMNIVPGALRNLGGLVQGKLPEWGVPRLSDFSWGGISKGLGAVDRFNAHREGDYVGAYTKLLSALPFLAGASLGPTGLLAGTVAQGLGGRFDRALEKPWHGVGNFAKDVLWNDANVTPMLMAAAMMAPPSMPYAPYMAAIPAAAYHVYQRGWAPQDHSWRRRALNVGTELLPWAQYLFPFPPPVNEAAA
eukprot:jgi/Mesvir1/20192/Mv13430-RA.1